MLRGKSAVDPATQPDTRPLRAAWSETPLGLRIGMVISTLATLSIALRPHPSLLWHPFIEDAYYSLSVSRNLALGNGLTIDGQTWTNGFQPLATFLYSIPFLGPQSDMETLRIVLLLQWLALIATAVLMGLIVRTYLRTASTGHYAFALGFLAYLGSFYAINTALNGLETGTLLLGYAALWRLFQVQGLATTRDALWLGLTCGLVGLIRIDSLVIIGILILTIAVMYGISRAVTVGAVALLIVLPWLVYGYLLTGSPIPSSGRAQTAFELSTFRAERALEAISASGFPWLPISTLSPSMSTGIRLALLVAVVVVFLLLRRRLDRRTSERRTETFAVVIAVGVLALGTYYTLTSFAFWFYGRYLSPLLLLSAFMLATCLVLLGRAVSGISAIALTATAVAASIAHWVPGFYQENTMYTQQVTLVREAVPDDEAVAASQTGTLGFFRPGTVNLDGKVNAEVLDYRSNIDTYLQQRSIDWMCDWPRQIDDYLGPESENWKIVAEEGEYICIKRRSN